MQAMNIPAGSNVLLGKPAKPMDQALVRSIAGLVGSVPGIVEAHLPQCYVADTMPQAAQVLVVVLDGTADAESVLRPLFEGLGRLALPSHHLDVLPILPDNKLLPTVRLTGCSVESPQTVDIPENCGPLPGKKWWKLW
jgi:hypothetical protein